MFGGSHTQEPREVTELYERIGRHLMSGNTLDSSPIVRELVDLRAEVKRLRESVESSLKARKVSTS